MSIRSRRMARSSFSEVGRYHRPLLELWQGGGVFASQRLPLAPGGGRSMKQVTAAVLSAFGMQQGPSHTEFIWAHADGRALLPGDQCPRRGAHIAEMTEAATGINLWEERATGTRRPPPTSCRHRVRNTAASPSSLARQEYPHTAGSTDPEIFYRIDLKSHIGFVFRSPNPERVEMLLNQYMERIVRDYQAVLPPADRATM